MTASHPPHAAWTCSACTFSNDALANSCDVCTSPRPPAAAPKVRPLLFLASDSDSFSFLVHREPCLHFLIETWIHHLITLLFTISMDSINSSLRLQHPCFLRPFELVFPTSSLSRLSKTCPFNQRTSGQMKIAVFEVIVSSFKHSKFMFKSCVRVAFNKMAQLADRVYWNCAKA